MSYPFEFGQDSRQTDCLQVRVGGGVYMGFVWQIPDQSWRGRAGVPNSQRHYTSFGDTKEDCAQMILDGLKAKAGVA